EIVFLGDTVNTAARIQDFCRETGDRILASADARVGRRASSNARSATSGCAARAPISPFTL
ncbi:MAG TPA: hypothetical protein VMI72_13285, partial [Roseiarcus sp.]|nr:hypothetical protein [Roseiarcus sp.]